MHNIDSLVAAIRDNTEIMSQVGSFDTAMQIARRIRDGNRSSEGLVELCACCQFGWLVLDMLIEEATPDILLGLISDLATTHPDNWGQFSTFQPTNVVRTISKSRNFVSVAINLRRNAELWTLDHPFVQALSVEAYWQTELNLRIARKDWRRAWETVKTSSTGGEHKHLATNNQQLAGLVKKMFSAMLKAGAVEQQPQSLKVTRDTEVPVSESRKLQIKRYHPRQRGRRYRRAGWEIACRVSQYRADPLTASERVFDTTGLQALAIAAFVSKQRATKREKKFKKLFAENT